MPYASNGQISTDPIEGGIEITAEQYASALSGMMSGKLIVIDGGFAVVDPPAPEPPEEPEPQPPTEDDYASAIQAHIDDTARSKRFADGGMLAGYVNSTVPQWAQEAQTFVAWRDAVWIYAYTELEKVLTGQRPQPTVEEIVAELPEIVWP